MLFPPHQRSFVTGRLDHEKENRKQRARAHGTERASSDFPLDPARTPAGRHVRKQFARAIDELLGDFARLPVDRQGEQAERYRQGVTRLHDSHRSQLSEVERLEFAPILHGEWTRGLDAISGSLPRKPAVPEEPRASRKNATSASPAGRSSSSRKTKTAGVKAQGM